VADGEDFSSSVNKEQTLQPINHPPLLIFPADSLQHANYMNTVHVRV